MKVLVSGASGFIGSALVPYLEARGCRVTRLVRGGGGGGAGAVEWDPLAGRLEGGALEGFDAAVHLSGENLSKGRWNAARKQRLLDSRVLSTRLLAESLAARERPPRVLVTASAIGYYGSRGDERLTEASPAGAGFASRMCVAWEGAAGAAAGRGIRVASLRIGMVLAASGGALAEMLPPFKLGLGGALGSGRQYVSWIERGDLVAAIDHTLRCEALSGPVNAVAPHPVTSEEFAKALGRVLGRPAALRVPRWALRLALGEIADEVLLASVRAFPARLEASGFRFRHPEIEEALRHALGRRRDAS